MPSAHILKIVDKNWLDALEESNIDLILSYGGAIDNEKVTTRKDTTSTTVHSVTLPPLRLRTPRGGELEIDSTFQKQLRVAKLCHMLGLSEVLTEWRFPKTQVPSRPDFSRTKMVQYRHAGRPSAKELEPPTNTPSKYHIKNLHEETQKSRSDNVPSYVAAYLESSPRDPLAAEESTRRAAGMLNVEAAPKKVFLPIVNRANIHDKPLQPTDIREPVHPFPHWCFGCRLEHGIQSLDTHSSYKPFRDRPVRVGGGFSYMDRQYMEPDYMAATRRESQDEREGGNFYRKHDGVPKAGELPRMYRPGFIPFKPKAQPKEQYRITRLPDISENASNDVEVMDYDPSVLMGNINQVQLAELDQIHIDLQLNNRQEQVLTPDGISSQNEVALGDNSGSLLGDQKTTIFDIPYPSSPASSESDQHGLTDKNALGAQELSAVEHQRLLEDYAMSICIEEPSRDMPHLELSTPQVPADCVDSTLPAADELELEENDDFSKYVNKEETIPYQETYPITSHIGNDVDLAASLQQSVLVTSFVKEMSQITSTDANIEQSADYFLAHSTSVATSVGSPISYTPSISECSSPNYSVADHDTAARNFAVRKGPQKAAGAFGAQYKRVVLKKVPAKPANDECLTDTVVTAPPELTPTNSSSDVLARSKNVKRLTEADSHETDVTIKYADSTEEAADFTKEAAPVDDRESVVESDGGIIFSTSPIPDEETQVLYSPLLGEKPEFRWVVQPLEELQYEDNFVLPDVLLPPVEQYAEQLVYTDNDWLAKETNNVSTTIITSKEYVPIWRITREILHDVMEDVMKRIAKKKAPSKKVKGAVVKKPARKVKEVKQKTPSPLLKTPTPPPPREPTPPSKVPTPPPKEPTPPPKEPTPPPREPTPPKPVTPPPKRIIELPPLPQTTNIVPKTPSARTKLPAQRFGTSLVSHSTPSRDGTPSSTLSTLLSGRQSPDYEFNIVPRSPSPNIMSVTSEVAKPIGRVLDSKVGNDWTFRQRLNVPVVTEPLKEHPVVETLLPDIIEKWPTLQPEPKPEPMKVRHKLRKLPRNFAKVARKFHKKSAPTITKKELKTITDPLDYMAKYCLIHPDRLPVYERIFKEVVAKQSPRFSEVYCVLDKSSDQRPFPVQHVEQPESPRHNLTDQQKKRLRDIATMEKSPDQLAMNIGEYQVSKITFTIDQLQDKYNNLLDQFEEIASERERRLATVAKELFPHVLDPNFVMTHKKTKKSKKSGKTTRKKTVEVPKTVLLKRESQLSDADIVERLDSVENHKVELDEEAYKLQLKLNRLETKVNTVEKRLDELEAERVEMEVWSQELYMKECAQSYQAPEQRRQQSALFNKFHPDVDEQVNIEEVEEALRTINGHLLTDKELQFIYHILKIPGRKVLNMKMFGCVAALSEKVQQLHPVIRKLINKFDFEALDVKMEKCKELYQLLYDGHVDKPHGAIPLRALCVELQAGGLTEEHLNLVTNKINSTQKGYVEYMDFLTYVPLFVELHDRICNNPLATERVS